MKKNFHKYTADRTIHEYIFVFDKEREEEFMELYKSVSSYGQAFNLSTCITYKILEDDSKKSALITTGRPDLEILFNAFELKSKKCRKVR